MTKKPPDGYILVPIEPTREMWMAANSIPIERVIMDKIGTEISFFVTGYEAQDIWTEMIRAYREEI